MVTSHQKMQAELAAIKARNSRVEGDKAWETSLFRKATIAVATYIVAAAWLYSIGAPDPHLNALVPAMGFVFSTVTMPPLKKWWLERRGK
jgi:hypothetical protein